MLSIKNIRSKREDVYWHLKVYVFCGIQKQKGILIFQYLHSRCGFLDETNITGCLHFLMQNIEMSCDLDRASTRITSTSANNALCLSTFA